MTPAWAPRGRSGGAGCTGSARNRPAIRPARAATVGASNSQRSGTSTPSTARRREIAWIATRELPPAAKKSSCRPIRASPSTSRQTAARVCSTPSRGAASSATGRSTAQGSRARAARSTLPTGVNGSSGRTATTAGTM